MPDLYREPIEESPAAPSEAPVKPLNSVEQEIADLEKQLAQKRALINVEKERPLEQAIGAEKSSLSAVSASAAPLVVPVEEIKPEVYQYKRLEKNQQLKNLVDLAFQKGVIYAADVARNLESPYLMDEFHDALVGELHKELVDRGKLEEI